MRFLLKRLTHIYKNNSNQPKSIDFIGLEKIIRSHLKTLFYAKNGVTHLNPMVYLNLDV